MMKIGIIGCGSIANSAHIPCYLESGAAQIKYFCDIIPQRAEDAVQTYGCGTAVTDYRQVLADEEVEAISICTPNHLHAQIAIEALQAGKHVLCEKPAARTYQEVQKMQKAQHESGKVLNIGVVNRFATSVNKIKELIAGGQLGQVYQVYVSFRSHRAIPGLGGDFTNKAVAGGGVLIDWGVHFFDIVMYCCQDPQVRTVSAEQFQKLGNPIQDYVYETMWAGPPNPQGVCDVEEGITGVIRTDGPTITFNGAWAQNIGENEMFIDFMGTKGGVRLYYQKEFALYATLNGMLTKTTFQMKQEHSMFQNEINAFLDGIKTGKKLPSHIDTNIITAEMMDAIYRSAQQHREIVLEVKA